MTRFPTVDPAPERELRERLGDVLLAGREASEEEALLVGLLGPLARIDSLWLGVRAELRASARRPSPNNASRATRCATRSMRCKPKPPWSSASPRQAPPSPARAEPPATGIAPNLAPSGGRAGRALGPGFCCPVRSTRCSSQERSARTATEQERCLGPLACRVWAQRGPTAAVGSRRCAWTGSIGARVGGWLSPRCSSRCGGGAETGVGVEVGRARSSSRRQANPIRRVR